MVRIQANGRKVVENGRNQFVDGRKLLVIGRKAPETGRKRHSSGRKTISLHLCHSFFLVNWYPAFCCNEDAHRNNFTVFH